MSSSCSFLAQVEQLREHAGAELALAVPVGLEQRRRAAREHRAQDGDRERLGGRPCLPGGLAEPRCGPVTSCSWMPCSLRQSKSSTAASSASVWSASATGLIWPSRAAELSSGRRSGSNLPPVPCRGEHGRGGGLGESARVWSARDRAAAGPRAPRSSWPAPGDSDPSRGPPRLREPPPPCPAQLRRQSAWPAP